MNLEVEKVIKYKMKKMSHLPWHRVPRLMININKKYYSETKEKGRTKDEQWVGDESAATFLRY